MSPGLVTLEENPWPGENARWYTIGLNAALDGTRVAEASFDLPLDEERMAGSTEDFGMPEAVEGRDIALDILSGEPGRGWSAFLERYENQLKRQAGAILRWAPALHSFGQAEDLVQGFLADQVMNRPDTMFGPTASGEQPLWPRLSRSFTNYCNHILRGLARQRLASEAAAKLEAATEPDEASERDDMWSGIERRVRDRQAAIRLAFSSQEPGQVPLGHLLLLSERLFLARLIEMSLAETDSRPSPGLPIPELVHEIAPWTPEECQRLLPPRHRSLQETWDSLTQPVLRADGESIARALGRGGTCGTNGFGVRAYV